MAQLAKIGTVIEQRWGLEEEDKKEKSGDNKEKSEDKEDGEKEGSKDDSGES